MTIPASDRFRVNYAGHAVGAVDWPATTAAEVTPSDDVDLSFVSRGLWVGGAGDIVVVFAEDETAVTVVGVPAGQLLPFRVKKVLATGTTATDIVALG